MSDQSEPDPLNEYERNRSNFVRELVQRPGKERQNQAASLATAPPRRIIQFWDDLDRLPQDVKECMGSWRTLEQSGFEIQVFDECTAREFIRAHLGSRYERAFDRCYHPSMKSDFFRYSYIFLEGGFYVDADDVYHGAEIDHLFLDGRLKLQPFCYDISAAKMLPVSDFLKLGAGKLEWIFYFNNSPLIAAKNHPIVERALMNATTSLEKEPLCELPEIQTTTGPGNLTRSLFEVLVKDSCPEALLLPVHDWERISTSKWPLSYRNDKRNWRLSNQKEYRLSSRVDKP